MDNLLFASSFLISSEFKERYGVNTSNSRYVEVLYQNVLVRDYDQAVYDFWLGNFNTGIKTRYELLLGFSESDKKMDFFRYDWFLVKKITLFMTIGLVARWSKS